MVSKCIFEVCLLVISLQFHLFQCRRDDGRDGGGRDGGNRDGGDRDGGNRDGDRITVLSRVDQRRTQECDPTDSNCNSALLQRFQGLYDMPSFMREFSRELTSTAPKPLLQDRWTCPKDANRVDKYKVQLPRNSRDSKLNFDGGSVTISAPTHTGCIPRSIIAECDEGVDDYLYFPACVYAKRCGGCCHNPDYMQCKPSVITQTQVTVYKISKSYPMDGSNFMVTTKSIIDHKECQCECIKTAADCVNHQFYDPNNCVCACPANAVMDYGSNCGRTKFWSSTSCSCECHLQKTCDQPKYWDKNECACKCNKRDCTHGNMLDPSTCSCVRLASSTDGGRRDWRRE